MDDDGVHVLSSSAIVPVKDNRSSNSFHRSAVEWFTFFYVLYWICSGLS